MNQSQLRSPAALSLLLAGVLVSSVLGGQRGTITDTQPDTKPIRIGADGKRLTNQEVADLLAVLPRGEVPWLINGSGPGAFGVGPVQSYQVYMAPISAAPDVRHGVAFEVARPTGMPSGWYIRKNPGGQPESFHYAQIAIAGRSFDQVQDENDANQPFRLTGVGDDADLVSLITFVRSRYSGPVIGVLVGPLEFPPIEFLRVAAGEVRVTLRQTRTEGTFLSLRRLGRGWEVLSQGTVSE